MSYGEAFGGLCVAFSPALLLFAMTVAGDPVRVIVLTAAAFCWMLSSLASSLFWFAVVPLRDRLAFGMLASILLQELFRYGLYRALRSAERGLRQIADDRGAANANRHVFAYVAGLGFGAMSGCFAFANVAADALGPATVGLKSGSQAFVLTGAILTLCIILLHTFWSVIFFAALDDADYLKTAYVVVSHLVFSSLTCLNKYGLYYASIVPAYCILFVTMAIAYRSVGGTLLTFKRGFCPRTVR